MNSEDKIRDLEIKVAYLEKTIDDLSSEIIKQDNKIKKLSDRLDEFSENLGIDDIRPPERPPHY